MTQDQPLRFKVKLIDKEQKIFVDGPWPMVVLIDKALLNCGPKFIEVEEHVIRITVENGSATYWKLWDNDDYVSRFKLRDCTYGFGARVA